MEVNVEGSNGRLGKLTAEPLERIWINSWEFYKKNIAFLTRRSYNLCKN